MITLDFETKSIRSFDFLTVCRKLWAKGLRWYLMGWVPRPGCRRMVRDARNGGVIKYLVTLVPPSPIPPPFFTAFENHGCNGFRQRLRLYNKFRICSSFSYATRSNIWLSSLWFCCTYNLPALTSHLLLQRFLLFSLFTALRTILLRRRYPAAGLPSSYERVRTFGLRRTQSTSLSTHVHKRFRLHVSPLLSKRQIYSFALWSWFSIQQRRGRWEQQQPSWRF